MEKNVQGVCAPSVRAKYDPDPFWNLREDYKELEQIHMLLRDKYSELARMLGFESDIYFGDPIIGHQEVIKRLAEVVEKAWMYDELN